MLNELDEDGDGKIQYAELAHAVKDLRRTQARSQAQAQAQARSQGHRPDLAGDLGRGRGRSLSPRSSLYGGGSEQGGGGLPSKTRSSEDMFGTPRRARQQQRQHMSYDELRNMTAQQAYARHGHGGHGGHGGRHTEDNVGRYDYGRGGHGHGHVHVRNASEDNLASFASSSFGGPGRAGLGSARSTSPRGLHRHREGDPGGLIPYADRVREWNDLRMGTHYPSSGIPSIMGMHRESQFHASKSMI